MNNVTNFIILPDIIYFQLKNYKKFMKLLNYQIKLLNYQISNLLHY